MNVTPYKTHKITAGEDLFKILVSYLPKLEENTIVVITSKIISICQNAIVPHEQQADKQALIKEQAEWYYIDEKLTKYGLVVPTIVNNILIANAGIDESNVNEGYLLWPSDLHQTTRKIWEYLRKTYNLKNIGVLITDSRLTPLTCGITGAGIDWCGFEALQDYRGKPDIFGRALKMSQKSILNGLAATAVVVTGEGNEQTPLATITDIPFVKFQQRPPTDDEKKAVRIPKEDDIYGKMLTSVNWERGGRKY